MELSNRMKWLKRVAIGAGASVAVLVLAPFLIPLSHYIPRIEKAAGDVLRERVTIESLHASLLPVPHARIDGITIGTTGDIRIARMSITPDLWSLLGSAKTLRRVDLEKVTLSQKAIALLTALTQQKSDGSTVSVREVRIRDATVKLEQSSFGPFDVKVQLSTPQEPGEIALTTRDGALKVRAVPQGAQYLVDANARGWTPPLGPPIKFDTLEVHGVASSKGADFGKISGALYDGTLTGKVSIGTGKELTVRGNLELTNIELKNAVALVSPKTRLSGRLDAKPTFRSQARTAAQIGDALRLETPFAVHNGVLYGFDLIGAATSFGRQGTNKGETHFDRLTGHLVLDKGAYRFSDLDVAASGLAARGTVTIAPSKALSGQLSTSVKALGKNASIPLTVAGTLDSPLVYPSAGALVGAAAGTVVLPGAGTAAGAKLGELVDGLFGKNRR
jgi:uncharacterized protein involved in outer membrane biogenesis